VGCGCGCGWGCCCVLGVTDARVVGGDSDVEAVLGEEFCGCVEGTCVAEGVEGGGDVAGGAVGLGKVA
jgi:hypothetical protein